MVRQTVVAVIGLSKLGERNVPDVLGLRPDDDDLRKAAYL